MVDATAPTIEEATPVVPTFPDELPPTVVATPPTSSTYSVPPTIPPKKNSSTKGFWAGLGIIIVILAIVFVLGRTIPDVKLTVVGTPTPTPTRAVQIVVPATPTASASATPTATPSAVRNSLPTRAVNAK